MNNAAKLAETSRTLEEVSIDLAKAINAHGGSLSMKCREVTHNVGKLSDEVLDLALEDLIRNLRKRQTALTLEAKKRAEAL